MNNGSPIAKTLDIHKYPNRRFYDATRSTHVKLDEIYDLIRQGYEITVTDSKTSQDITTKVLAQIILELDPPKLGIFPVSLLHRLIRANEKIVLEFTQNYFTQAVEFFLESQKHLDSYLRQATSLQQASPDWRNMVFNPFIMVPMWKSFMPSAEERRDIESSPEETAGLRKQISELRSQIHALESQLEEQPNSNVLAITRHVPE